MSDQIKVAPWLPLRCQIYQDAPLTRLKPPGFRVLFTGQSSGFA